jgi:hypothetical protein
MAAVRTSEAVDAAAWSCIVDSVVAPAAGNPAMQLPTTTTS